MLTKTEFPKIKLYERTIKTEILSFYGKSEDEIPLPKGSEILSIKEEKGNILFVYMFDLEETQTEIKTFRYIYGNQKSFKISPFKKYWGTFFVGAVHIFEIFPGMGNFEM